MELQSLIYLFVATSFTIYFSIALWTKASSTKDFYIVKDTNYPSLNGVSIAIDFISAATFVSFAGVFLYSYSIVNYFILGIIFGFILLAFIIVPKLREDAEFSIPAYLNKKLNSKKLTIFASIIVLLVTFLYLNAQIKATGIIVSRIFQIDFNTSLFVALIVTILYAGASGKRNISYAFIAQYIIIFISFATPIIFLTITLTDSYFPQFTVLNSFKENQEILLSIKDSFTNFNLIEKENIFNNIFLSLSIALGVATLPHILIKFFATSSVKKSKKSVFWGFVFISIIYSFAISIPALSVLNFSENVILNENIKDNKQWLNSWKNSTLVSYDNLNNKLEIEPDTIFLLNSEIANMPNWIIALVISGALAATLSTITALLILIKGTLTNDFIFQNSRNTKLKQNTLIAILIISATFFNLKDYTILKTIILAFSIGGATLFPTLLLTMFKNLDKNAIFCGLFVSSLFMFAYITIYNIYNLSNNYLFITPEACGVLIAFLNIFISLFCSKFIFNKKI